MKFKKLSIETKRTDSSATVCSLIITQVDENANIEYNI